MKADDNNPTKDQIKKTYINLRDNFAKELEPKAIKANKACWEFYINSTPKNQDNYQKADDEVQNLYKNEKLYNELKDLKEKGLNDKHLDKQLKNLVKAFDEELNAGEEKKALRDKENEIAAKYNSYVMKIDNTEVSKAEVNQILETEKDVNLRQKAYEAKIKGGDLIAEDLKSFVKMRNEFARKQGYENFFEYQLQEEYDVDSKYLDKLLSDVYNQAKYKNAEYQNENKQELADEYDIKKEDLKAHHYGLITSKNPTKAINEALKTKEQVVDIAKTAYAGMGYNIDKMPITLDLFPKKNKNTHGFCFEIEAGKDSRILANLTNNVSSIDTLCHELGHCIYNLGIDTKLPYFEKGTTPAMTEAIAMMMGDLVQREDILADTVEKDKLLKFKDEFKKAEARFINHSMQIIEFEREMYKNPDQDLGKLWHDLKCKYKGRNEDELIDNEWATIPHYLSHPAYYQNYFRAALIKAQMYNLITKNLGNLTENKNTAEFLNNGLFTHGLKIEEDDLIKQFTGKPLSTEDFCNNII